MFPYMENFNKSYDGDLVAISPIPTVPAGVYSDKYDSLDDIKDGAKVAVPNDASNTARCYLMLQKIGWIKIDENADPSTVTQEDIVENPYNIQLCAQLRVCSQAGGIPVYPRFSQPDNSESWDDAGNGI